MPNPVSGAILSNTIRTRLSNQSFLNESMISGLTSSTYSLGDLGLLPDEIEIVLEAYATGLRYVFILFTVSCACSLLLCLGIGNTNLKRQKT